MINKTCQLRSYVRARFRNIFGWSLELEVRFSDSQTMNHAELNVSEQSLNKNPTNPRQALKLLTW